MKAAAVVPCPLPPEALLQRYAASGAYTDCYAIRIDRQVTQADFVEAFYTTWLFRIERAILKWAVARPSSDDDARRLARGDAQAFAAWSVEARDGNQVLLGDFSGRTKSWLMVMSAEGGTRLYFGSAVVPLRTSSPVRRRMGAGFQALLGFHKLYSRLLLGAASAALRRTEQLR